MQNNKKVHYFPRIISFLLSWTCPFWIGAVEPHRMTLEINQGFSQFLESPQIRQNLTFEDFFPFDHDPENMAAIKPLFEGFLLHLKKNLHRPLEETQNDFLKNSHEDLAKIGTNPERFRHGIQRLNERYSIYYLTRNIQFACSPGPASGATTPLTPEMEELAKTSRQAAQKFSLPQTPEAFYQKFGQLIQVKKGKGEQQERARVTNKHKYEAAVDFFLNFFPSITQIDDLVAFKDLWKKNMAAQLAQERADIETRYSNPSQRADRQMHLQLLEHRRKGRLANVTHHLERVIAGYHKQFPKGSGEEDLAGSELKWDIYVAGLKEKDSPLAKAIAQYRNTHELGAGQDEIDLPGFVQVMEKTVEEGRLDRAFKKHFAQYELSPKTGSKKLAPLRQELRNLILD